MGQWNALPGHLLAKIDEVSKYIERIRIRAVCVSWHSCLPKMPSSTTMRQLPWLLRANNSHNKLSSSHEFFNPLDQDEFSYYVNLPFDLSPEKFMLLGISNGWMINIGKTSPEIVLVNPITLEKVHLPPRSKFPDVMNFRANKANKEYDLLDTINNRVHCCDSAWVHSSFTTKIVWCPDPAGGDFMAAAIYGLHWKVAYCESGYENWKFLPTTWDGAAVDIIFYKGQLYALSSIGSLDVFESLSVTNRCPSGRPVAEGVVPPNTEFMRLVESSCGELLLVAGDPVADEMGIISNRASKFRIFRFDPCWGWNLGWEEVKTIEDEMIFLSLKSCISISLQNFSNICQRNCIYFTDDIFGFEEMEVGSGCYCINSFSLENGSVEGVKALEGSKAIWFRPNFDRVTATDGIRNKIAKLMSFQELGIFSRQILLASVFHVLWFCLSR